MYLSWLNTVGIFNLVSFVLQLDMKCFVSKWICGLLIEYQIVLAMDNWTGKTKCEANLYYM